MTNLMKKIVSAALAITMTMTLAACGAKEEVPASSAPAASAGAKMFKIGISQFGEHASLDNCREGFLQGLAEAGLSEGTDYEVMIQNASFDGGIATQIGQTFSAENVDLMVGIATPSATACYAAAEDKNIPVIFTAITDPVEAKLDSGNVTGTSDKLPSSIPPPSPTPFLLSPSTKPRAVTMASPSRPWASPLRQRSPRRWIPLLPGALTA